MAITSPLDLGPLVWVNPTAGSYTGSNLTSLANAGTVGGSFTVTGTIAKSTAIGSFTTLRMDNISKRLNLTFAVASGVMTVVYWGKFTATTLNGIMGKGWPGDSDAKAFYANVGSGETIAFAKGCCAVDAGHAPALDATAGGINDTNFHTLFWQMGATNALFRDNSSQTITTNATGAMPSTGSVSWNFGSTDPTSEPALADIAGILVFDFALTSTQRNDLDTWIQGQAAGTRSGTATITMALPSLATAGTVKVQGTLAKTLALPALVATGKIKVQGALAKTLALPALVTAGTVTSAGSINGVANIVMSMARLAATGSAPAAARTGGGPAQFHYEQRRRRDLEDEDEAILVMQR